ncbi:DUF3795 domain-containing protein [Emergencia timonensis]
MWKFEDIIKFQFIGELNSEGIICRKCEIKDCIRDNGLSYCFECSDYSCKLIKNLEKSYNKRYQASHMKIVILLFNKG